MGTVVEYIAFLLPANLSFRHFRAIGVAVVSLALFAA